MNDAFRAAFGGAPEHGASAPGRVNLIGEHTDYNDGFVLPTALPHETHVLLRPRAGRIVRAISLDLPGAPVEFALGAESPQRSWGDYVQGVTWAFGRAGAALGGFDLLVRSDVPIGKGLSSSASLEIAVGRALRRAFAPAFDDVALAMLAHRAETEFVGAPVGIMDQMACSIGDRDTALFLDTRSRAFERIPIPPCLELGVIDSGLSHAHAGGEYRTRRRECEEAASRLGVKALRDVAPSDPRVAELPAPLDRRARHVVTENARVLAAVDALRQGAAPELGRLFSASHASMRDDFEVSLPDIDRLVAISTAIPGALGARMTGGGFGGAVVVLCQQGTAREVVSAAVVRYRDSTHCNGAALLPHIEDTAA